MKTCPNCHYSFDDTVAYCSVCGASLAAVPPTPTPVTASGKPPSLGKAIAGLVLSASGLECAVVPVIMQLYFALFHFVFYIASVADPSASEDMMIANGFLSGYSTLFVLIFGGFALALALVGRHLTNRSAEEGNRSRLISVSRILSRVAIILLIAAAALTLIQWLVFLVSVI